MDDTVERCRRVPTGDETGAGDEPSGAHHRAEASGVDHRLVVDGTAPSSRGVDDHLDERNISESFDLFINSPAPPPAGPTPLLG